MSNVSSFPAQAAPIAAQHSALRQFLVDLFTGIQDGREIAVRYHALARLSPAELASRGLTRQDVPHAALTGLPREPQPPRE
jgi:hypothetical protein